MPHPTLQPVSSALPARSHARAFSFASVVVIDELERRRVGRGLRFVELTNAVTAAVASFLTIRCAHFPRFASHLLARFEADRLPGSTVRALRRIAVQAIATRLDPAPAVQLPAVSPAIRAARQAPPRAHRQPRTRRERAVFAVVFVGCRRRTAKQANTAGFATVAAWIDGVDGKPTDRGTLYRDTAHLLASRIVASATRDGTSRRVRDDLKDTATDAIGLFIARRMRRFPRLAADLLTRFIDRFMPRSTWCALRRAIDAAIDDRALRLAVHPPFARVSPMERANTDEIATANAQIGALLSV